MCQFVCNLSLHTYYVSIAQELKEDVHFFVVPFFATYNFGNPYLIQKASQLLPEISLEE